MSSVGNVLFTGTCKGIDHMNIKIHLKSKILQIINKV